MVSITDSGTVVSRRYFANVQGERHVSFQGAAGPRMSCQCLGGVLLVVSHGKGDECPVIGLAGTQQGNFRDGDYFPNEIDGGEAGVGQQAIDLLAFSGNGREEGYDGLCDFAGVFDGEGSAVCVLTEDLIQR